MSNSEKVVLVTGGSSGIGKATSIEFAKLGYKVVITGRKDERLKEVFESLVENSPSKSRQDFLALKADFEDPAQVDPVVEKTVEKFGKLDILINNAGFPGKRRKFSDEDFYQDFQTVLQANLMAPTRIAQLAAPHLLKAKGVIINVSSIADRVGIPTISYSVSKAGLSMLTKTLANALDGSGVRVVTVSPGPILTSFSAETAKMGPMSSLLRAGESIEVADTILFLASDKASYIHGCTIDVDGGSYAKFGGFFTQKAK